VAGLAEAILRRRAEPRAHDRTDRRRAQRRRAQQLRDRIGGELADEVFLGVWLDGPAGRDDRHRQSVEPRLQEAQEALRGAIRPVDVVDQEHHRLGLGEVRNEPVEAVKPRERGIDRAGLRRLDRHEDGLGGAGGVR
jgi:hypothetical protein